MRAVYYYDRDTNTCPVERYFGELWAQNKKKTLADIDQKIQHVVRSNGLPTPPISTPLHGYSFFEVRTRKDKDILIRVLYFRHEDMVVLLNAFEKTDNYRSTKEKREIQKILDITKAYQQEFINDPILYEEYKENQ